ncbi:MAG: DEAD/DEAH box helicase [Desulfovibrionaceae bacterium]
MGIAEYIRALLAAKHFAGQVVHHRCVPAQEAVFAPLLRPYPAAVQRLLTEQGLEFLYAHQARAMDCIRGGQSVVVATPTASGKSLIYNLPVVEQHVHDPDAHALYIFPLKALAQDQRATFERLVQPWPADARPTIALYDGDTSDHFRRKIRRDPPSVLITTPEMLHLAILPFHEQWTPFLAGLSHVVVDEAHTYRGVLGAHMAQVFRRLNRLTGRYGLKPTYILCTATVGNPEELAANLVGAGAGSGVQAPRAIVRSGAPQGARHFVFINPEASPATAAIDLLKAALARNLRTIVYCRSRRMTELVSMWAIGQSGQWKERISAYRAGFLPEERRDIEARMHSGALRAVITTSALELGIDIGGLDLCILVGYPGTVMATLQRGGRVGRAQQESAVVLVAGEDALDQYFMRHPEDFFTRPAEQAVVNPDNEVILKRHLECAAAEFSLQVGEACLHSPAAQRAVAELEREGLLLRSGDGASYVAARKRPQRHVDLRGCGQTFTIENTQGQVLGTVDGQRAYKETHPGAVYLHRGVSYVISALDTAAATVKAQAAAVQYYTKVRTSKETEILECSASTMWGECRACFGRLRITEHISGYEKRACSGNRLLTIVPLEFPPHVFETEGLWYAIPDSARIALEEKFLHFMGGIHAMEHAIIGMLPLTVMADRNDFGGISTPMHAQVGLPAVFIYDAMAGGAGLCRAAFAEAFPLLQVTLKAIRDCPCEDGCPSCVHSPKCGSGNRPISKQAAQTLLARILDSAEACTHVPPKALPHYAGAGDVAPCPQASLSNGALDISVPLPARYMVLDVETRRSAAEVGGWNHAERMGVSVAVVYDAGEDSYFSYTQDELPKMFARLREAAAVVGFNSARFDYAVLQPFAPYVLKTLPTVDMLERIKERLSYRVSLDNVAQATLEVGKSADGLQALRWWTEGKVAEIAAYCQQDVEITRRVYMFGCAQGHVLFTNKAGQKVRALVDFGLRRSGFDPK